MEVPKLAPCIFTGWISQAWALPNTSKLCAWQSLLSCIMLPYTLGTPQEKASYLAHVVWINSMVGLIQIRPCCRLKKIAKHHETIIFWHKGQQAGKCEWKLGWTSENSSQGTLGYILKSVPIWGNQVLIQFWPHVLENLTSFHMGPHQRPTCLPVLLHLPFHDLQAVVILLRYSQIRARIPGVRQTWVHILAPLLTNRLILGLSKFYFSHL